MDESLPRPPLFNDADMRALDQATSAHRLPSVITPDTARMITVAVIAATFTLGVLAGIVGKRRR